MQIINDVSSAFFPLNSKRSTTNDLNIRVARDTLNHSGSSRESQREILLKSVLINKRQVPRLEATGPLSAFRVADVISLLSKQSASGSLPIMENLEKKESFTLFKLQQLNELSATLKNLGTTVSELLADGGLNPKSASSTWQEGVLATSGKDAPRDAFRITSVRLSKVAILASEEQSTPLGTLGLTGSFFINGTKITVESSDTLIDLKNKINFGEDHNRNGVLDKTEDVNNNGILEILQTRKAEFVPAIFINEDLDGDGEIDPDEDINDNGQLDGGIAETRVKAIIQDNRLILIGLAGGRTKIDLLDNDNVLLNLGFFELNIKGFPVQKELQFDSDDQDLTNNLIQEPQTAIIQVDGKTFSSDNNVFSGVVEDTDLTLTETSEKSAQINISIDASAFFTQIKTFFDHFNDSVSKINNLLGVSRVLKRDEDIQDIRNDLTTKPQDVARNLAQRNENIDTLRGRPGNPFATGIRVVNPEKNKQQEVAVTSAAQRVKSGINRVFQGENENLLRRLGSIGIRSLADNTFVVDEKEFSRGIESNTTEIFDLFTNPATGILPNLEERLAIILRDELGELAIKENKIKVLSRSSRILAENFRKFSENTNLEKRIQTLIAVA